MRIYVDMCSLQRPLDDKSQLRVLVEAQAILGVLALCESGKVDLIASEALVFENDANPDAVRRDFTSQTLAKATQFVQTDEQVQAHAQNVYRCQHQALGCTASGIGHCSPGRFPLHQ